MEAVARLMTDLEEEILFQLTISDSQGSLALADKASVSMDRTIPLGVFHETMLELKARGFVQSKNGASRKIYSITDSGKEALQQEWAYYKSLYKT